MKLDLTRVLGRMFADPLIAAADVAAFQALTQVHIGLSDDGAFLAASRVSFRFRDGDGCHVRALTHESSPFS